MRTTFSRVTLAFIARGNHLRPNCVAYDERRAIWLRNSHMRKLEMLEMANRATEKLAAGRARATLRCQQSRAIACAIVLNGIAVAVGLS